MSDIGPSSRTYFVAEGQDVKVVAGAIQKRVEAYYQYIRSSGRLQLYRRSYLSYYRGAYHRGRLMMAGEQAEFTTMAVNNLRNLLQHILVLTTSKRPAFDAKARNTDHRSQAQAILTNGILDYIVDTKPLQKIGLRAAESALVFDEGFVTATWDQALGKPYGVDSTGQVVKEGDIAYKAYTPLDLAKDWSKESWEEQRWIVTIDYVNRYELSAQHPELEEEILGAPGKYSSPKYRDNYWWHWHLQDEGGEDDVPVYTLYHKQTDALPQGRVVRYVSSDAVLFDGPLPYEDLPVYRIAPAEQANTAHGYTPAYDLLPLQHATDMLNSTIVTNQSTFGVQNVMAPKGHGMTVTQLSGGLNLIEYNGDKMPQALNLTQTAPEIFKYLDMVEHMEETISGVNAVARGNPPDNLKSGAALALVEQMTIRFNTGFENSWTEFLRDVAMGSVKVFRKYVRTKKAILLGGNSKRTYQKEFIGADLEGIERVDVDIGNPMTRTVAGRVNLAEMLLQMKRADGITPVLSTPEDLLMVMSTGKLEALTDGETTEEMLVLAENEAISDGSQPHVALRTDDHPFHIKKHLTVLNNPDSRQDPQLVARALDAVMQHEMLYQQQTLMEPAVGMALGIPPSPMPQAPMLPPGPGGAPTPPGAPPGPGGVSMPQPGVGPPAAKMPNMPTNPLTGERAPGAP